MADQKNLGLGESAGDEQTTVYSGLSVQLKPAPLVKRVVAYCVDLSIISLLFYLVVIAGVFLFMGSAGVVAMLSQTLDSSIGMAAGLAALLVILAILLVMMIFHDGYFLYFEYKKGTTPGKKIFGLKVVSLKAGRLSLGQVVLRHLFRYIDCAMIVPGVISVLVTERRQRIGDLVASTLVVHSDEREHKSDFLYLKPEDYHLLKETLNPGPIPEDVAKAYLRFSYPHYILNHPADGAVVAHWEREIRNFLPAGANLETAVLLRFFAEWCLQRTRTS
jgi:uncharacterized RDD family membrane protein YckC